MRSVFVVLSCLAFASGCLHTHSPAESQDQSESYSSEEGAPYETFNEDNYGNVPSYGSGSETSTGYYGTGSKPAEEAAPHKPAEPSVRQHQPY